jgi:single-strand DNA-binding protein
MMPQINVVMVEGFLVKDAELAHTPKGAKVCNFSIGVNRSYKSGEEWQQEVSFFEVRAWGKLAEICAERGKKGMFVRVQSARLKQDRWTDTDNKNHSRVVILAERLLFDRPKKNGEQPAHAQEPSAEEASGSIPEDTDIPF